MGVLSNISTLARRYALATSLVLSGAGAGAIVGHEGLFKTAYKDPVGIVTICAGHTATAKLGQTKTEAQCRSLLLQDVAYAEHAVQRLVTVKITQSQFDALVSFTFNLGEGALAKSTLLKKLNAGQCLGAGAEFSKWDYAGAKRLAGLTKRRADERKAFESGCVKPTTT